MPTLQVEAQIPPEKLLEAVAQLSQTELDRFIKQVMHLRAHARTPGLSKIESDLLLKINQGVPPNVQKRFDELNAKRKDETLTPTEHDQLLQLIDVIEDFDAQRAKYLAELAQYRGVTLPALMQDLGIRQPEYA